MTEISLTHACVYICPSVKSFVILKQEERKKIEEERLAASNEWSTVKLDEPSLEGVGGCRRGSWGGGGGVRWSGLKNLKFLAKLEQENFGGK